MRRGALLAAFFAGVRRRPRLRAPDAGEALDFFVDREGRRFRGEVVTAALSRLGPRGSCGHRGLDVEGDHLHQVLVAQLGQRLLGTAREHLVGQPLRLHRAEPQPLDRPLLQEPAEQLGGIADIVLTWSETTENLDSIEMGAFRVLGDTLVGGNA